LREHLSVISYYHHPGISERFEEISGILMPIFGVLFPTPTRVFAALAPGVGNVAKTYFRPGKSGLYTPRVGNVAKTYFRPANQAFTPPGWQRRHDLLQPFANLLDDFPCPAQFILQVFTGNDRRKANRTALRDSFVSDQHTLGYSVQKLKFGGSLQ
jgi:hypothetical protein